MLVYLNKPWAMKLDDLLVTFRTLCIATNVIIAIQDPLRNLIELMVINEFLKMKQYL